MKLSSNQAQARLQHPAIVDTRRRIREQIRLIRAIRSDGGDTELAERVLRSMLRSLAALRWTQDVLAAEDAALRDIPSLSNRLKPPNLRH